MIGGTDIIIQVRDEIDALEWAVRSIRRLWPQVVLEDPIAGEVLSRSSTINFSERREILAFRDSEAARLWDDLGVDPSLTGTLVHFLVSPGELTVAVDDVPPPQVAAFVEALRSSLNTELFASTAIRKEAA